MPKDSIVRARDRLYKLKQRTSVAIYLGDFRNIVIDIPGITDSEKLARLTEELMPHILLEIHKSCPTMFEEAAKIPLDVDGAFYGAGLFSSCGFGYNSGLQTWPAPLEIGNVHSHINRPQMCAERMRGLKTIPVSSFISPDAVLRNRIMGTTSRKERIFKVTTPKHSEVQKMTHVSRKTKWSA